MHYSKFRRSCASSPPELFRPSIELFAPSSHRSALKLFQPCRVCFNMSGIRFSLPRGCFRCAIISFYFTYKIHIRRLFISPKRSPRAPAPHAPTASMCRHASPTCSLPLFLLGQEGHRRGDKSPRERRVNQFLIINRDTSPSGFVS